MAARTSGSLRISLRPGIPAIPGMPPAPGKPPENPTQEKCMTKNIQLTYIIIMFTETKT